MDSAICVWLQLIDQSQFLPSPNLPIGFRNQGTACKIQSLSCISVCVCAHATHVDPILPPGFRNQVIDMDSGIRALNAPFSFTLVIVCVCVCV